MNSVVKLFPALLFFNIILSQNTWLFSGRIHPELDWSTIKTANFNIHYHQGLEEIAVKSAAIAEGVRPTLLRQINQSSLPKIDIILTAEDEIMNGFALWTYTTFIWVDQNDAAIWLEDEKWLYQVLSHELQHIVFFRGIKSWLWEPWSYLLSGTPAWFVEGLAEYETEHWRPYRSDLSHKSHIITDKLDNMDPHHDGFSKLLYWSDRFGDSTIVNTIKYRTKLKIPNFKKGFKKATGITVKQFNEDWRRHMNTYYYGIRAQKEALQEIGEPASLPIKKMQGFIFSDDSSKIALIGSDDKNQQDQSLIIAVRDTFKENEQKLKWENWHKKKPTALTKLFSSVPDSNNIYKEKIIWDKNEIDYGRFHSALSWSPGAKKLLYAKYHFGQNQALVWDLRLYEAETKKKRWLTNSLRATYPCWSPDTNRIVFVAHELNVSNLYLYSFDSDSITPLTNYTEDTQINYPAWSPTGKAIAYAASGPSGNMDIYILDILSNKSEKITSHQAVDFKPIWNPDGKSLVFTSHRQGTPNIYTIKLSSKKVHQVTDVGEAVWAQQWLAEDSLILANTLNVTDSVRIIKVDPRRPISTKPLSMRSSYSDWITAGPLHELKKKKTIGTPEILVRENYRPWKFKHFLSLIIPEKNPFFMTQWNDAMGRNMIGAGFYLNTEKFKKSGGYLAYTNAYQKFLWSGSFYRRIYGTFRLYDDSESGLFDRRDGLIFTLEKPYNFGTHISRDHRLGLRAELINFTPEITYQTADSLGLLPQPQAGREGLFSIYYQWSNRRPHKWNWYNPIQGSGIFVKFDIADRKFFGDFTYGQFTLDGFFNLSLGPTAFYFRLKSVLQNGNPPAQNYVGLSNDPPLYLSVPLPILNTIFPENHNLRGWEGYKLGSRLIFGTMEYRLPLVPRFISVAVFSDFANVWSAEEKTGDFIVTGGYEARLTTFLFTLSAGVAQTRSEWQSKKTPEKYFRLVLISPL